MKKKKNSFPDNPNPTADPVIEPPQSSYDMKKNDALVEEFRNLMPEVYVVGDANRVKNIKNANQIAFNIALEC